MELEYKLSDFIDSCLNEGQLETARLCYIYAAEQKKITQETYIFLKKLADQKERFLKRQMDEFKLRSEIMQHYTDLENQVDIFEVTHLDDVSLSSDNVAKVADTMTIK